LQRPRAPGRTSGNIGTGHLPQPFGPGRLRRWGAWVGGGVGDIEVEPAPCRGWPGSRDGAYAHTRGAQQAGEHGGCTRALAGSWSRRDCLRSLGLDNPRLAIEQGDELPQAWRGSKRRGVRSEHQGGPAVVEAIEELTAQAWAQSLHGTRHAAGLPPRGSPYRPGRRLGPKRARGNGRCVSAPRGGRANGHRVGLPGCGGRPGERLAGGPQQPSEQRAFGRADEGGRSGGNGKTQWK
jgi:hypothetical protein